MRTILTILLLLFSSNVYSAEIMIKVGNGAGYEDGDVLNAMNDRRIKHVHAQMITHPKNCNLSFNQLHSPGCLFDVWQSNVKEYKFERISPTQVRRTNLETLDTDIVGPSPNVNGEYMNVQLYINRRLKKTDHGIFGTEGSEYWYGGKTNSSLQKLSTIWTEIEANTQFLESDHTNWPYSPSELKKNYVIKVEDFSDSDRENYTLPLLGSPDAKGIQPILKSRKNFIDWENSLGLTAKEISDIKDVKKLVDHRTKSSKSLSGLITIKQ